VEQSEVSRDRRHDSRGCRLCQRARGSNQTPSERFRDNQSLGEYDLANRIENAANELRVEMSGLLSKSLDDAKSRAAQAEQELKELEKLMTLPGPIKTVRLVHDADGKSIGAVISERKR
jgi:hypothetical protein